MINEKQVIKNHYKKIGRMGGLANTEAQRDQRKKSKPGAGRPKGAKNRVKTA